ncbi:pantothenate kinase [Klebsiella pneumoniae]|uniref:Pantothenate kinase n=1 Tax=Klebsiella pneumoniae TaxID=573 RepID=A0A377XFL0_KLEPN|nr:pantothenate kinase [Klebsiella pneumoniae]
MSNSLPPTVFLHPNSVLKERGLMKKKGFPQSYDMHRLVKFVSDLKSGVPQATAPGLFPSDL